MTQWTTFVGIAVLLAGVVLVLARASVPLIANRAGDVVADESSGSAPAAGEERHRDEGSTERHRAERAHPRSSIDERDAARSPGWLLANVAVSHGLFATILLVAAWYAQIPPSALGIGGGRLGGVDAVVGGVVAGILLYGATEIGGILAERAGFDRDESLRTWLAPETGRGWIVLLIGVLPLIALFEELLFRAALIGAASAGFGISPWPLAAASSVTFALGHGAQGRAGIVVTGIIGFALASIFVISGSLIAVVVAHYVVNGMEFVIHEGIGAEHFDRGVANR